MIFFCLDKILQTPVIKRTKEVWISYIKQTMTWPTSVYFNKMENKNNLNRHCLPNLKAPKINIIINVLDLACPNVIGSYNTKFICSRHIIYLLYIFKIALTSSMTFTKKEHHCLIFFYILMLSTSVYNQK